MKLTILATTDIHGSLFPTNYTTRDNVVDMGLSRIASAIKHYSELTPLLLVDNGDSFQGTPLLTYAHQHADSTMNPMAQAFNTLGYDFINLGNHDFNYGPEILHKYIKENEAMLLTSNVFENGRPLGSTKIVKVEGYSIAFIGVLTHYIPNWERPSHIENMTFEDAYEHLKFEVENVKDSVDYVVAMYHGGLERDPQTGEPTERLTGENQGYDMSSIEGLDLLITGHQHRSLVEEINGVVITQTTLKGAEFALIDIDLENKTTTARIENAADYPVDTELLEQFETLQEEVQVWLDEPVGTIHDDAPSLIVGDEFEARVHKHPIVSFINQVQRDRSGADVSSVALFNGTTGFNKAITMRELVGTYLYPNTLVVKEMTGKALKEMIEFSAHYFSLDADGTIIASPEYVEPKPQHYNYDMLDGVTYTINVSKPRGSRVSDLMFNGKPLNDTDTVTLVTNNYRAMGGGNYAMVAEAPTLQEIQEEMVDTIMTYLEQHPYVNVDHEDNIKVIK